MFGSDTLIGRVANVHVSEKRATFQIGVTYGKGGTTHWLPVVAFDAKLIETIAKHVPSGRMVHI